MNHNQSKAGAGLWLQRMKHFIEGTSRMLAPSRRECLICHSPIQGEPPPLGLCRGCFGQIPWITDIRCPMCGRYEECHDCKRREEAFFRCSRSAVRYNELMKEWLALYKYRGQEKLLPVFGGMLYHGYSKLLQSGEWNGEAPDLITFTPVNEQRLLERGFNQAEQLARHLGREVKRPVVPLLRRVRYTGKQSFKTRAERLADLAGAFSLEEEAVRRLRAGHHGSPLRIVLVDDIYTTGSTLNQCSAVICSALPAEVYGLAWAR
ncbi:ComF family protein [Paenibacillus aurantius]|uniref:ComF family protein n=1 Tax=Paenibacillus aurantius TaxID=2918900 RepID=A0AA96LDZ3_9BACL|nr:ComF family protein [Paenibacillus aurantius]WNQ11595.1 ComF family protein [Paenibacillus aurantius]